MHLITVASKSSSYGGSNRTSRSSSFGKVTNMSKSNSSVSSKSIRSRASNTPSINVPNNTSSKNTSSKNASTNTASSDNFLTGMLWGSLLFGKKNEVHHHHNSSNDRENYSYDNHYHNSSNGRENYSYVNHYNIFNIMCLTVLPMASCYGMYKVIKMDDISNRAKRLTIFFGSIITFLTIRSV